MNTVIRKKKKIIILCIILLAAILIGVLSVWTIISRPVLQGIPHSSRVNKDVIEDYKDIAVGKGLELAAQNDVLKLYFDNETGGIAIEDNASGEMFYSSPQNAMEDTKASDTTKMQLSSPLLLTYYNLNSKTTTVFDSYTNAVLLNQISWAKMADGIRVQMVLGREESARLLPEQISSASFDELAAKVEETSGSTAAKRMKAFYLFYSAKEANEEQLEKYPALAATDIYTLKTSVTDRDKKTLEEYYKKAGYTYDEMQAEYEALGHRSKSESFPCFHLSVDYILSEDTLDVSLNIEDVEYDRSQFYLTYISLLPYFGAGQTGEEGYVFLPDGSGTLIGFNNENNKTTFLTRGKTYGYDAAETNVDRGSIKNEFRYPVFGIKTGNKAIFGIITEGDAVSGINCELGNISHSYNASYADFMIRYSDKFMAERAFEQEPWVVYDKNGYNGRINMKYYFLTGKDANYVGMAKAYRSYLINEKIITAVNTKKDLPFILETIGTVRKPVKKLGIPVVDNVSVTSFDDAMTMVQYFTDHDVTNMKLRYLAWYNGGYYHTAASKMKVEKVIGSKNGLLDLAREADQLGAEVYPDVNFLVHDDKSLFDNYSASRDGVRTLFQKNAYYPLFLTPLLKMSGWYYCVNPQVILSYFSSFTGDYDKLGLDNISLGSTGNVLNSNYNKNNYVNREESKNIIIEMLRQADEKYNGIMVDGGNAYTFGYADYILNLPTTDSSYLISDQSVPFIQIALHGYVQYTGNALNLSSNLDKDLLTCIEYGTVPYFLLCYESSTLKESGVYDSFYSVNYDVWKEQAVSLYHKINEALSSVQNIPIQDHVKLAEDVYLTTYENGTGIYVNYSDENVEEDGITIAPMSYAIQQIGGR